MEDRWPVFVRPIQKSPEVLEDFDPLNEICLILPCEIERRPLALVCNCHIPPPPPHLDVLITSRRPLVLDDPPRWHVHSAQVTARQRFRPLLNHHHLGPGIEVHEVITKESCTMSYRRTPQQRTLQLLQHPGEGHHIGGWPSPYLVDPPCLGDAYAMDLRHVGLEVLFLHHHPALSETNQCLITLPKSFSLPRCPSLIRRLPPLLPDETGCTYHRLGLLRVHVKLHPAEHLHYHSEQILEPLMILPAIIPSSVYNNRFIYPESHPMAC